jgi:alkanesulfonate monooxygenase SsuD/methylene tetrahydromethanopterin reductase-like flavin-dependent oxidoreductase (luciferase family)
LFQAFSVSEETIRWCAREKIIPTILLPQADIVRKFAEAYQEESAKAGRNLKLGERIGVVHSVYLANNKQDAYKLGEQGVCGVGFNKFFYHFGFAEAFRVPGDEAKYPAGKKMLPASELTMDRFERCGFAYFGNVADVRREMDALNENVHPEWFVWQTDQGFLPKDEVKRQLEVFGKEIIPRYK